MSKKEIILGIGGFTAHASACLLVDGEIVVKDRKKTLSELKKKAKGKGKKADEEIDTPVPTANLQLASGLTLLELNEPNLAFLKNASGILTPSDSHQHVNTQSGTHIGTAAGATTQAEETKSSHKKIEGAGKQSLMSEDQNSVSNNQEHKNTKPEGTRAAVPI